MKWFGGVRGLPCQHYWTCQLRSVEDHVLVVQMKFETWSFEQGH